MRLLQDSIRRIFSMSQIRTLSIPLLNKSFLNITINSILNVLWLYKDDL